MAAYQKAGEFKMKRRTKKIFYLLMFILLAAAALKFAGFTGRHPVQKRKTVRVTRKTIVDKALAVGAIQPLNEIEVKSKISGVVGKLYVEIGDFVRAGQPLLEVRPDPTPIELAQAKRDVEMARIEKNNLFRELKRSQALRQKGLISQQDFEKVQRQYDEAQLKYQMRSEHLQLLEKGKTSIAGKEIETIVKAPMSGYILEKNVNVGDPVVPLTSYQPGTSLLRMANMNHLIFKGTVDEIDVGKIREGLPCQIQIGALPGKHIKGHVTHISLKAKKKNNATVFPVEIRIDDKDGAVLRAGYSANADIIIAQRDSVPALPERVVTFRHDSAFVQVPVGENGAKEKYIKTGLSNAIFIEVVSGLQVGDVVLEKPIHSVE